MMMADGGGVMISSVLYGPDARTRITAATREVLFAVYAPPGTDERSVVEHLEALRDSVRVVAARRGVARWASPS